MASGARRKARDVGDVFGVHALRAGDAGDAEELGVQQKVSGIPCG